MYRISEISMKLDGTEEDLKREAAARLKVSPGQIRAFKLYKKSVDARKKNDVHFICTVDVDCGQNHSPRDPKITEAEPYRYELPSGKPREIRPMVARRGFLPR